MITDIFKPKELNNIEWNNSPWGIKESIESIFGVGIIHSIIFNTKDMEIWFVSNRPRWSRAYN